MSAVNSHREASYDQAAPYVRNYKNDLPAQSDTLQRTMLATVPFFSLCAPQPVSLVMGSLRAYNSENRMQTAFALVALASSFFQHKIGMGLTTLQDTLIEIKQLSEAQNWEEASRKLMKISGNLIQLSWMVNGGIQLSLLSYAIQALIQLLESREEFKNGRWIEGVSNLLMAGVHMHGLNTQYRHLQETRLMETSAIAEIATEVNSTSDDLVVLDAKERRRWFYQRGGSSEYGNAPKEYFLDVDYEVRTVNNEKINLSFTWEERHLGFWGLDALHRDFFIQKGDLLVIPGRYPGGGITTACSIYRNGTRVAYNQYTHVY
jgi:hypothetical protein